MRFIFVYVLCVNLHVNLPWYKVAENVVWSVINLGILAKIKWNGFFRIKHRLKSQKVVETKLAFFLKSRI